MTQEKVPCKHCGTPILLKTAQSTGELCMPCCQRASDKQRPHVSIEDLDRQHAQYIQSVNDMLQELSGKGARWWRYFVSHRTFELVVGDAMGEENFVILLEACETIAGPVEWPDQHLELIWHCHRDRSHRVWEYTLKDESVGFCAEAFVFACERNVDVLSEEHRHDAKFREITVDTPSENVTNMDADEGEHT